MCQRCSDCIYVEECDQIEKNKQLGGGICDNFFEYEFFDEFESYDDRWLEMSYYRFKETTPFEFEQWEEYEQKENRSRANSLYLWTEKYD